MVVPLALVPVPVAPQGDSAVVQVVRVIDGDTLQVHSCGGKHAVMTWFARTHGFYGERRGKREVYLMSRLLGPQRFSHDCWGQTLLIAMIAIIFAGFSSVRLG